MDKKLKRRAIELLAPARDAATAIAAIDHGADAIYIGASSHGARSAAGNSLEDLSRVVDYAHRFSAKVYVTVNTLVYDDEIEQVKLLINNLYRIGVDALIVQDMGILEMDIPPIALHASTQCDTRDATKARFLQSVGFSRIVLARELSIDEIRSISTEVSVPLEAFVHGALCVSFSGDCRASLLTTGRSANRGECAQICRLEYDLTDSHGTVLIAGKHLLSLKDMNRINHLEEMMSAGVSSFKIEGRLKDIGYVKNVTAAYRRAIDAIIERYPDRYFRSSRGKTEVNFEPSLEKSFNRGFTSYFLNDRRERHIASIDTPKSTGSPVGTVISNRGQQIIVKTDEQLANGDGLGFFDLNGQFTGFRANRIEGNRVILRSPIPALRSGMTIYRNRDRNRDREMDGTTATRYIPVDMTLRKIDEHRVALDITVDDKTVCSAVEEITTAEARTPQKSARRRVLEKLGDTVYRLDKLDDRMTDAEFIPASQLTSLRRKAVESLDMSILSTHHYDYRRQPTDSVQFKQALTSRDNVANHLAEKFYRNYGATSIERAVEVDCKPKSGDSQVMECRYCLRRELGACLKEKGADKLPAPLFLQSRSTRFKLEFDCRNCMMKVIYSANSKVIASRQK